MAQSVPSAGFARLFWQRGGRLIGSVLSLLVTLLGLLA
ncbi:MAG TPA: peptide ABC transporter permease, partial [Pantoea agglomerans]|nr:peptide ABC transporter permease [Pantoea agglomerans]